MSRHSLAANLNARAFVLIFGMGAAVLPLAGAQDAAAPAASELAWGGDFRFRNEYFNNALTLNDEAAGHQNDYFRARARFWAAYNPEAFASFNLRATAEPRDWTHASYAKQHVGPGPEWRYAIVDTLNAKFTAKGDSTSATLTIGRQDIQYGDTMNWWLIADGTPGDGSWTTFTDAVRLSIESKSLQTTFDVICLNQGATPAARLDILGRQTTYSLTEQNERGVIVYASNKSIPKTQLDGYYIYKHDHKVFSSGDNADIHTVGAKLSGTPSPNFKYSIEAATQWGAKQDSAVKVPIAATARRDIQAFGANASVTYFLRDARENRFGFAFEYLSGDKPGTGDKDEMFDILWGRYPRWSDVYIFSYAPEAGGRMAQMADLVRFGPTWGFTPVKNTTFSAVFNLLLAPEAVPTRATNAALFSQSGHVRGQLVQLILRRQFTKSLSGLLQAEFFQQGTFYTHRDLQSFFRFELAMKF